MNQIKRDNSNLEPLLQLAKALGATAVRAIASNEIAVEDRLAHCCWQPGCDNYGLSAGCPPHVTGPAGFRKLQKDLTQALVLRLVVPSEVLFSCARREVEASLHELVARVEQQAVELGYTRSQAFACGSCKQIFCRNHKECRRLSLDGTCRNPLLARPSMSGFGIHVSSLMKTCGWSMELKAGVSEADREPMAWLAGLVIIG